MNGLYIFPHIGNFITPTDEVIFFRGAGIPPTIYILYIYIYTYILTRQGEAENSVIDGLKALFLGMESFFLKFKPQPMGCFQSSMG